MTLSFVPLPLDRVLYDTTKTQFDVLLVKHKLHWSMKWNNQWKLLKAFHRSHQKLHTKNLNQQKLNHNFQLGSWLVRWAISVLQHMEVRGQRDDFHFRLGLYHEDLTRLGETMIEQLLFLREQFDDDPWFDQVRQQLKHDLALLYSLFGCIDYVRLTKDEIAYLGLSHLVFDKLHDYSLEHKRHRVYGYGKYNITVFTSWPFILGIVQRTTPMYKIKSQSNRVALVFCLMERSWHGYPTVCFTPETELKEAPVTTDMTTLIRTCTDVEEHRNMYNQCVEEYKEQQAKDRAQQLEAWSLWCTYDTALQTQGEWIRACA